MIYLPSRQFDLLQICRSGQCFRMRETADGIILIAGSGRLQVSRREGHWAADCSEAEFEGFWRRYFDLDTDYGSILAAIDPADAYLTAAARFGSGIRILRQDPWEMLVTFLISQQNNIPRIRRCVENLCRTYGRLIPGSEGDYLFPTPEALAGLPEDGLMACNLGYRSKYVVRAAEMAASGAFSLQALSRLSYKDARACLLQLYGVGEKVADCVCLFGLHHLEAFPVDTHIRQALDREYPGGFPRERYRGCEGVLQQYIFYRELTGGGI